MLSEAITLGTLRHISQVVKRFSHLSECVLSKSVEPFQNGPVVLNSHERGTKEVVKLVLRFVAASVLLVMMCSSHLCGCARSV